MIQKTALVTGASRGIGKAIAEQLKKDGVRLLVPTRKELDLLSNRSIDLYLKALTEPVDILVNDAGINRLGDFAVFSDAALGATAGVNALTRSLAVEAAPYNVLVNAVAPGYVNTELTRQNNSEQDLQNICRTIPMQRLAEPEEIARLVTFLCSEQNTYLTGQCLVIDGGYTCQ